MSEKIAVHCKTEEEWDAVKGKMKSRSTPSLSLENAAMTKGGGCHLLSDGGFTYDGNWALNEGYTIIPASEYLREEEFKVGDRVEVLVEECNIPIGSMGTIHVMNRSGISLGVELDDPIGPHSLQDHKECRKSCGKWYEPKQLKKLNKQTNKPIKEESNMNVNSTVAKVFKDVDEAVLVTTYLGQEYSEGSHRAYMSLNANSKAVLAEAKRLDKEAKKDK